MQLRGERLFRVTVDGRGVAAAAAGAWQLPAHAASTTEKKSAGRQCSAPSSILYSSASHPEGSVSTLSPHMKATDFYMLVLCPAPLRNVSISCKRFLTEHVNSLTYRIIVSASEGNFFLIYVTSFLSGSFQFFTQFQLKLHSLY